MNFSGTSSLLTLFYCFCFDQDMTVKTEELIVCMQSPSHALQTLKKMSRTCEKCRKPIHLHFIFMLPNTPECLVIQRRTCRWRGISKLHTHTPQTNKQTKNPNLHHRFQISLSENNLPGLVFFIPCLKSPVLFERVLSITFS